MPFRFTAAQRDQALFFEPLKDGPIVRELEPALTASLEMLNQPLTDIPADRYTRVMAPSEAEDTSFQYLANTPVV
jgi:hypothetical protein